MRTKKLISYCKKCGKNLCNLCEPKHSKHTPVNYKEILKNKNWNKFIMELRIKIDNLKYEIKDMINKFNKVLLNLEIYYNILNNIDKTYNPNFKSYQKIVNINNFNAYSQSIIKDIEKILNESRMEVKFKYIDDIYGKIIPTNDITLKYKIGKEENVRIFGDTFVNNNKENYQMIINGKKYDLCPVFNIKNLKERKEVLEVKLKELKPPTDLSYMFFKCTNLLSLSDVSKWNTNNVTTMKGMFQFCTSLIYAPGVAKLNTDNVTDLSYMFCECVSLPSLPDISRWNTTNVHWQYCLTYQNGIQLMFKI